VIAKNLDRAPRAVQIQALELLRTRRIFTRTAVQAAPKQFLFVAVTGDGAAATKSEMGLSPHLIDLFYLAHWHDPEDGFANLNEQDEEGGGDGADEDGASTRSSESVVKTGLGLSLARRPSALSRHTIGGPPAFTEEELSRLAQLSRQVHLDVDVLRYQMNIIAFLRMHRAVSGGITPTATKHFEQLMKSLAALHGLDYVTPSLVAMAAKKVYFHRIRIVTLERERSVQWGSDLAAVEAILEGIGPEEVIEDVLDMVVAPL
jgi:hypothetical protein